MVWSTAVILLVGVGTEVEWGGRMEIFIGMASSAEAKGEKLFEDMTIGNLGGFFFFKVENPKRILEHY